MTSTKKMNRSAPMKAAEPIEEQARTKALTEWCDKWKVTAPQLGANFLDGYDAGVQSQQHLRDENAELKIKNYDNQNIQLKLDAKTKEHDYTMEVLKSERELNRKLANDKESLKQQVDMLHAALAQELNINEHLQRDLDEKRTNGENGSEKDEEVV